MKRIIYPGLAAVILLASCQKNELNEDARVTNYSTPNSSNIKFLNSYTALTPSLGTPTPNGPTVDFYVGNQKMNATAMGYFTIYPAVSGSYAMAPNGVNKIKAVLNRTTGTALPSDTIAVNNFNLGPNANYTAILIDEAPNPTPINPNLLMVQESPTLPAYGKFKLRLLNLVVTNDLYELYNSTAATVVTAGIPFKNLSDWIELPVTLTSSTYQIRKVGTTTSLASVSLTPSNQRSYTFWARGNTAVTGRPLALSTYISL
jgi:hypothetical protein